MKIFFRNLMLFIALSTLLSSCARDMSSNTYSSDSTLSSTLEGKIINVRPVTIEDSDKMSDNIGGMLAGGVLGGVLGSAVGAGSGRDLAIVGGAIAGGLGGAALQQKLGKSNGLEYIVKVDTANLKDNYYGGSPSMRNAISSATTSGLVTVVQGADNPLSVGQKVYIIFSDKRTRIISAN